MNAPINRATLANSTAIGSERYDPLLVAITNYHAALAAYVALPDMTGDEDEAAVAATFGPHLDVLQQWTFPAKTRAGAIAALKLAVQESVDFMVSEVERKMIAAALVYFEGETSDEAGADLQWEDAEREETQPNLAESAADGTGSAPIFLSPFRQVCDMEDPLTTVSELALALCRVAEGFDSQDGAVVICLANLAMKEAKVAEELRAELFHLLHPRRAHFDKVGWPA